MSPLTINRANQPARKQHETFEFELLLTGPDVLEPQSFERLDETCEDAIFGHRGGVQYAAFEREGASFDEAVANAIRDVETAVPGLIVLRVEPDELVTPVKIAERLDRSAANINQLISGARGPGDFPAPVAWVDSKTRLWRWSDVAQWFKQLSGEISSEDLARAEFVAALNGALEARHHQDRLTALDEQRAAQATAALAMVGFSDQS